MSTPAVTVETPAVSERRQASEHSTFLSNDKHYRLTGELPEEKPQDVKPEVEDQPVKEGDSAPPSETAAGSEPAKPQERRTQQTSENRWQKLSRENRELRERLAKVQTPPQRETSPTPQPAAEVKTDKARTEPQYTDKDEKTGLPKYKDYNDYLRDLRAWDREEAIREFESRSAKTTREQQLQQAAQIVEKHVAESAAKARQKYPDYNDTIKAVMGEKDEHGRDALFYTSGSHIDAFFLDAEGGRSGHDVMYYLAKNWNDARHIFARDAQGNYLMNPVRQIAELTRLEDRMNGHSAKPAPAPPAKPVTRAPQPPHQTSGNGAVSKDAVSEAVEAGDADTYIREQNARALARRKGK
jgi:hypothetical protein